MDAFNFKDHALRTVEIEGEPWFVAADVCRCIGYDMTGGQHQYTKTLRTEMRRKVVRKDCAPTDGKVSLTWSVLFQDNRAASHVLLSEAGLYTLVLRAQRARPSVIEFQNWVTKEVLPSIRKTGGYLLNENARATAQADARTEMPLPPAVLEMFKNMTAMIEKQTELMEKLVERINTAPAPSVTEEAPTATLSKDFYSARDVNVMLQKAGAMPTVKEFTGLSIKIGQQLSALSRAGGFDTRKVMNGQYPTTLYCKEAVEQFLSLHN